MSKRVDMRLPDELAELLRVRAGELGQSQTTFVVRALEAALQEQATSGEKAETSVVRGASRVPVAASPRASESKVCGSGCVVPASSALKRCVPHGLVLK